MCYHELWAFKTNKRAESWKSRNPSAGLLNMLAISRLYDIEKGNGIVEEEKERKA